GITLNIFKYARWFVILFLTLSTGLGAGYFGNRWGKPVDLVAAGKRIEKLRGGLGDWVQQGPDEAIDDESAEVLECTGSTVRVYRNVKTGASLRMVLLVGPSGPTSVHTPDICFKGANFELVAPRQQLTVPWHGTTAKLWAGSFRSKGLRGEGLRVVYAWNAGERWEAPENPRFAFMWASHLYKLMVVTDAPEGATDDQTDEVLRGFLEKLLPALDGIIQEESAT
ncbi:MAG TPA: hypothetical protein VGX78_09965, partial [Pirellulales bacterium]|nr:hypothetical protein [Pirellulales bacterium]